MFNKIAFEAKTFTTSIAKVPIELVWVKFFYVEAKGLPRKKFLAKLTIFFVATSMIFRI
jgi:hypothetical protein